jgi:hypothetical protein
MSLVEGEEIEQIEAVDEGAPCDSPTNSYAELRIIFD